MVAAGLLERFWEGAWAFYRIAEMSTNRRLASILMELVPEDDPVRLQSKSACSTADRARRAAAFFSENAYD